jgi:hypothetical protein
VSVGRLNEAVKRNRDRFPVDFMFQLTFEEFASLRSQIVTSNLKSQIAITSSNWGGRRHLPFAFTEHGVAMVGVEGKHWEEVALQTSSTFWKLIEERRNEPTISTKELRRRLKKRKK